MYFLLCTLSVVCHPPPFLNEIVSLCVCVCVCERERERERERKTNHINLFMKILTFLAIEQMLE